MALEGTYKELTSGYELVRAASGITCSRLFHDGDSTGTDSLPEVGDVLDASNDALKTVVVLTVKNTKMGGHPDKNLYAIAYGNSPGAVEADGEASTDPDNLPISGGLSGEAINIDGSKSGSLFVWTGTSDKCDQQLFRKIITGSFKVTKRLADLELNKWAQYSGKINSKELSLGGQKFAVGLILFNGAEFEEYRNNEGKKRWRVGFSFAVKAQVQGAAYVGWNYILDEKTNIFKKPVDSVNSKALYEEANLGLLLSGVEAT